MPQQVMLLLANPGNLSLNLGPTERKERINYPKLSSEIYLDAVVYSYVQINTERM